MSDEARRNLVDGLLGDAMELSPRQRREFLLVNAPDPDILAECLSLIEHAEDIDEEDAGRMMPGRATGDCIGAYRLLGLLGQGTFGDVYLAIREDLGQRVAIKLLKPTVDESVQIRFSNEARVLASFDHPHITRLIDYGLSPEGQLYLITELAEGGTLGQWVEQRQPTREELLRVFIKICDAVQYAHSNLLIHRDIKPSNILMTWLGEPKLADFGLVQMMGTLASVAPSAFAMETWGGAPAYSSPEQLRGSFLTTASDVYSLGVVLRKYLEPPPKPWTDDIDAILCRCTEHDPRSRYSNAGELRDEIRAYLDNRPVRAGRQDWFHLARLFVFRNRSAVVACVAGIGLLLLAFVWILIQNMALRAAVAEKINRINQVMEAAEHFDEVQRSEYMDSWQGNPNAREALAQAERGMRRDPNLETRFHMAVCGRALAEVLLRADGTKQRQEGWGQLRQARAILESIRSTDPNFVGLQRELDFIDGIRKELEAGAWQGGVGFASERIPPKLAPGTRPLEALADARSARAMGDVWRSLAKPEKAAAAYERGIRLFDLAKAEGLPDTERERDECLKLRQSLK